MLRPSNAQLSPAGKRRAARARAKLAQALEPYLPGVVNSIISETVEDLRGWLRDDALTAILDERMTSVRQVQAEVMPRDMTSDVVDDLIDEEVSEQVPGLVEEFIRERADASGDTCRGFGRDACPSRAAGSADRRGRGRRGRR